MPRRTDCFRMNNAVASAAGIFRLVPARRGAGSFSGAGLTALLILLCFGCTGVRKPPQAFELNFSPPPKIATCAASQDVLLVNTVRSDFESGRNINKHNPNSPTAGAREKSALILKEDPADSLYRYIQQELKRRQIFGKIVTSNSVTPEEVDYITEIQLMRIETKEGDIYGGPAMMLTGGTPLYFLAAATSYLVMSESEVINEFAEVEIAFRLIRTADYADLIDKKYVHRATTKVSLDNAGGKGQVRILQQAFQEAAEAILGDTARVMKKERGGRP